MVKECQKVCKELIYLSFFHVARHYAQCYRSGPRDWTYTFRVMRSKKINSDATFFHAPPQGGSWVHTRDKCFFLFLLYEADHAGGFKAVFCSTFSSIALNHSVEITYVPVFSKTSVRIGLSDLRPRTQYETADAVSINTVHSRDTTCCLARSSIQLYLMPFH
jgi:hypothetical protein